MFMLYSKQKQSTQMMMMISVSLRISSVYDVRRSSAYMIYADMRNVDIRRTPLLDRVTDVIRS
jgi:hypothetical protein